MWNGAILGSITSAPGSGEKVDPLNLLTQSPGPTGLLIQAHILLTPNLNLPFLLACQWIGLSLQRG